MHGMPGTLQDAQCHSPLNLLKVLHEHHRAIIRILSPSELNNWMAKVQHKSKVRTFRGRTPRMVKSDLPRNRALLPIHPKPSQYRGDHLEAEAAERNLRVVKYDDLYSRAVTRSSRFQGLSSAGRVAYHDFILLRTEGFSARCQFKLWSLGQPKRRKKETDDQTWLWTVALASWDVLRT